MYSHSSDYWSLPGGRNRIGRMDVLPAARREYNVPTQAVQAEPDRDVRRGRVGQDNSRGNHKGKMTEKPNEAIPDGNMGELVLFRCQDCKKELVYLCEDLEAPCFLQHCTYEAIEVWCPHCQVGYTFSLSNGEHPSNWTCPDCRTNYPLPVDLYSNPMPVLDPAFIEKYRNNFKQKESE